MGRLTQKDERGNWCLSGIPWEILHEGQIITRMLRERLYSALWKLMKYEDTGLEPDEVEEMLDIRKQKKVFKINPLVGKWEKYECPNCGCGLTDTDVFAGHCKWCGQALKL